MMLSIPMLFAMTVGVLVALRGMPPKVQKQQRQPEPPPKICLESSDSRLRGLNCGCDGGGSNPVACTHGGFQDRCLNHSATHPSSARAAIECRDGTCKARGEPGWPSPSVSPVVWLWRECRFAVDWRLVDCVHWRCRFRPWRLRRPTRGAVAAALAQQPHPRATIHPVQTIYTQRVWAAPTGFDAYKQYWRLEHEETESAKQRFRAHVNGLDLNRRAIPARSGAAGGPPNSSYISPFAPYQRRHVRRTYPTRPARYSSLYRNLARIQSRSGVDPVS